MREFLIEGKMKSASIQFKTIVWCVTEIVFLPHWHHHIEILRVKAGSLVVNVVEDQYVLNVGDLILINPNEVHYATKASDEVVFEVFQVDLFRITENLADIQQKFLNEMFHRKRHQINRQFADNLVLDLFLDRLAEEWRNEALMQIDLTGRLMLSDLLKYEKKPIEDDNQYKIYKHNLSKLKPSIATINHRYNEKITLDFLADISDLSAIHYTRLFKQMTQFTPIDYLNQVRAREAMRLLLNSEESIAQIAWKTGLKDANYFSRFFKHYSNYTPTTFRKRYAKVNTYED